MMGLLAAWGGRAGWGPGGGHRPAGPASFLSRLFNHSKGCFDSLVLCLDPQDLPLAERQKWGVGVTQMRKVGGRVCWRVAECSSSQGRTTLRRRP